MQYAIRFGERVEPTPGGEGQCPCCGNELIAHCGAQKIWHWKHKGRRDCDPWWENEGEWHRAWKRLFPDEWREVPVDDADGKPIHRADVKTPSGIVIEFQHSFLSAEKKLDREQFYRDMIWVVDGRRRQRDFSRFNHENEGWRQWPRGQNIRIGFADESFPNDWLDRSVMVVFDWGNRDNLICLQPNREESISADCHSISREDFVSWISSETKLPFFDVSKRLSLEFPKMLEVERQLFGYRGPAINGRPFVIKKNR
jgi:competence protein CoiA